MKDLWNAISTAVQASSLNKKEKSNVLNALDTMLGENVLAYKYPLAQNLLTLTEYRVYRDVVNALNEAKPMPTVGSEIEFQAVANDIKAAVWKQTDLMNEYLWAAEQAARRNDWDEVNANLQQLDQQFAELSEGSIDRFKFGDSVTGQSPTLENAEVTGIFLMTDQDKKGVHVYVSEGGIPAFPHSALIGDEAYILNARLAKRKLPSSAYRDAIKYVERNLKRFPASTQDLLRSQMGID